MRRLTALSTERCTSISVNVLKRSIRSAILKKLPGLSKEELCSFMLDELKKVTVNDQYFDYNPTDNHLGGIRWYFVCPKCGGNAGKLFLPPPEDMKREKIYACRRCHKIRHISSGQSVMYKTVVKPLRRLKEIEDKIKRGHLKKTKIIALLDEYEEIENKLKASPNYRLYSFKKSHDMT